MTVRRRLFGPAAAFLAALAVAASARAQLPFNPPPRPPFGQPGTGGNLTTNEVKERLERFLNRANPGAGGREFQPQLPGGISPETLAKLVEQFGKMKGGPDGKVDPKQIDPKLAEEWKKWLADRPEFLHDQKGTQRNGDGRPPQFDPTPGKTTKQFDPPVKGEDLQPPPDFKLDTPRKRPDPQDVGKQPMRKLPPPPVEGKGNPFQPPVPPDVPPPPPFGPPQNPRDRLPWEEPESPQEKARQAAAALWEKNVGPLDETPSVKKAIFDLADGTLDLKDPDGNNLLDTLAKEFGDGKSLGDLLDGVEPGGGWDFGGGKWDFPKFDWKFNWGSDRTPNLDPGSGRQSSRDSWWSRWRRSPSSSTPSPSSNSSWFSGWKAPRWNIGIPALDGTWLPVIFLIAALAGGVFLWRWLARRGRPDAGRIDPYALGPWPVDPFHLQTRQDVVVAFEHLSVLICGPVARTWTHTTIAAALSDLALAEPERALMLAQLYELARYTPVEEPLTTAELAEARRLVCRLAGFSDD